MLNFQTDIDGLGGLVCKMENPAYSEFGVWLSLETPTAGKGEYGAAWCLKKVWEIVEENKHGKQSDTSCFSTNSHAVVISNSMVFLEDLAFEDKVSPKVDIDNFIALLKEWNSINVADEIEVIRRTGPVGHLPRVD